jgi:carbonic anhydrase/acetyltransferase-like protein (isoleucine patch superfamily)
MVIGSPAKVVRPLKPEEIEGMQRGIHGYVGRAKMFKTDLTVIQPQVKP